MSSIDSCFVMRCIAPPAVRNFLVVEMSVITRWAHFRESDGEFCPKPSTGPSGNPAHQWFNELSCLTTNCTQNTSINLLILL